MSGRRMFGLWAAVLVASLALSLGFIYLAVRLVRMAWGQ